MPTAPSVRTRGRVVAMATYLWLLALAVLSCVWAAFLVPVRVAGRPVPIGVVLALATVPLCLAAGRLVGSRAGAVGPWLAWVATAVALGTRRSEGDLVVTGGSRGLAFLVVGFLAGALAIGLSRPVSRPVRSPPPTRGP